MKVSNLHYQNKAYSESRKNKSQEKIFRKNTWRMIRLMLCLLIFLSAVVCKQIAPNTARHYKEVVTQCLNWDMDYKAVAAVLGQAVSGEKPVSKALDEACSYVFSFDGNSIWN